MNLLKIIAALSLLFLMGCTSNNTQDSVEASSKLAQTNITVSTAASLKEVMEEIKPLYQQAYPQTTITYNWAASGTLQRQIEQGAPVDVFISADRSKIDSLLKQDLLYPNSVRNLFQNKLVLIAPQISKLQLQTFTDLQKNQVKIVAMGNPQSVPAGQYAQEVLNYFRISKSVTDKAVYGKDVRQVLNYVATGNADAGIVYLTDALANSQVKIIEVAPDRAHSDIIYAIAIVADSKHLATSQHFIEFLSSAEIQNIFAQYGFITIASN